MVVALGPSANSVVAALAVAMTPQITRLSRAGALQVKAELYMDAAMVVGTPPHRIILRHLLPNSFPPALAQITGYFGAAVVAETALSFLGLGVPPPDPSWGRMLEEGARQYFEAAPWGHRLPRPAAHPHRAKLRPPGRRPPRPAVPAVSRGGVNR